MGLADPNIFLLAGRCPGRLMWGSDWPVLNLNGAYDAWREAALGLTSGLPQAERNAVFGGTAAGSTGSNPEAGCALILVTGYHLRNLDINRMLKHLPDLYLRN